MDDTTNNQPIGALAAAAPHTADKSVSLQRPVIVGILYLINFFLGFSVFVGVVLAYVWRAETDTPEWEKSHYTYLIHTFWISFVLGFGAFIAWFVLIFGSAYLQTEYGSQSNPAFFLLFFGMIIGWITLAVWFCIRCILSMSKVGSRLPMPKPRTWLF